MSIDIKRIVKIVCPIATVATLALGVVSNMRAGDFTPGSEVPRFVVLPPKGSPNTSVPASGALPTWTASFTYQSTKYTYNMVGFSPATGKSFAIHAFIIPVKLLMSDGSIYDPYTVLSNSKTVVQNTIDSPMFDATTTYTQGGVNVGTTQYIDAFQRANFWHFVKTNPNSHMLLAGPTVLKEQILTVPAAYGHTGFAFGIKAAMVDINWFDAQLNTIMVALTKIQPNTIPIFMTYNTYLTSGGCCIGGYHSATGAQSYSYFTYVNNVGSFSQDVSALSHEIGEWADDPLVNGYNNVACGILEVGDPLERNANYGGYPYTVNGFTYNLQDLVTLPYFGANPAVSVNSWLTFQGETIGVCQNGG